MQAPGVARWETVKGLFGGMLNKFHQFAQSLDFQPLESQTIMDVPLNQAMLFACVQEFKGPQFMPRENDERSIQPLIHSILQCSAVSAEECTNGQRVFFVLSEPSVFQKSDKRVSDEAVFEAVRHVSKMNIIVEVKGTTTFPYTIQDNDFEAVFCQVLQQTALARIANYWNKELLFAAATFDRWFLFHVVDISDSIHSDIQLLLKQCFFHDLETTQYYPQAAGTEHDQFSMAHAQDINSLNVLVRFLTSYLCECSIF